MCIQSSNWIGELLSSWYSVSWNIRTVRIAGFFLLDFRFIQTFSVAFISKKCWKFFYPNKIKQKNRPTNSKIDIQFPIERRDSILISSKLEKNLVHQLPNLLLLTRYVFSLSNFWQVLASKNFTSGTLKIHLSRGFVEVKANIRFIFPTNCETTVKVGIGRSNIRHICCVFSSICSVRAKAWNQILSRCRCTGSTGPTFDNELYFSFRELILGTKCKFSQQSDIPLHYRDSVSKHDNNFAYISRSKRELPSFGARFLWNRKVLLSIKVVWDVFRVLKIFQGF